MATVKKEGKVPFHWKAEVTCKGPKGTEDQKGCGAVLEIGEKDLVLRHWFGTHFRHDYAAIKCPCCGVYTGLEVPDSVWERLDTAKNRKKSTFDGFDDRI